MLASRPLPSPRLGINLKGLISMEHEHKPFFVTDEAGGQTYLGEGRIEADVIDPSCSAVDEQEDARVHKQAPRRFRPI